MSLRFAQHVNIFQGSATTATAALLVGPIDVSNFETFCITFQNNMSAVALVALQVQAAFDPSEAYGVTGAPNWVAIPTSTLPLPSGAATLAASSTYMTSAIRNSYHYIRVLGGTTSTSVLHNLRVTVGGMQRA